ncbi:arylphorin subunit alpha-like isoform X2 [Trichoplusia ni]|uniref:Arylphorin subunit alpha-like isoform X2 n=1 Tax=Trichoplusia ni TaxID=7111 RepID=A0A7E5VAT2_TRINI|nr:arylphorin subunit alpha-like isoform X2 [Trichoplusia ni]
MKTLTLALVVTVLVTQILGYLIHVPTEPRIQPMKTVPGQWLHFQKRIVPLFENVCEVSSDATIKKLAQDFTPVSEDYMRPEVVTNFQKLRSSGMLAKGEIFTEYDPNHMDELKIIYEVMFYAKDFDTFYKAAAWARQNVNCGLYVNAIYLTMQSRKDTERLIIPAPYELLPNYFIEKDVIKQAASILAGEEVISTDSVRDEGNAYYLDANYTALFYDNEADSKLAYFREDVGLNSYYYLRKLKLLLPWFYKDDSCRFGENMYQMMKQFMARYQLERYANGLPEIESIDWNSLSDIPYDPLLIYSDGNEFNHRTAPLQLSPNEDLTLLQTIENNIGAVVQHLREGGYNKTHILNHLMEILVTGDRSYETLARRLLGKDMPDNRHVSVLEHFMTSMRDPMFWRINKKIVELIDGALKALPTYTRSELYFPGVNVVNIDVKKMMTAFDYFEFDVTDALRIDDSNTTFNVKIGQPRLNHKPFTIKLNVSSLVAKKGLVKIYLGPKIMPKDLATKKNLLTLLDMFEVNLKIGTNMISRSSADMKHFSGDYMSLRNIRKIIEDAEYGLDFTLEKTMASQTGYPSRLILPKGSPLGLPLQMFVFVAPFTKAAFGDSYSTNGIEEFNSAILSPGFPLDLNIESKQLFELPNAMIKYVTVTQKKDNKIENYGGPGITKQWYGANTYDPSSRPSYSAKNREPFDYNSRKGPYETTDKSTEIVNEYNVPSEDIINETQDDVFTTRTNLLKSDDVESIKSESEKNDSKEFDERNDKSVEKDCDKNVETILPRLLKSSKTDYVAKYKSKVDYDRKKYSEKYSEKYKNKNYNKYSTDSPSEEETVSYSENQEPVVDSTDVLKPIEWNNEVFDQNIKSKLDKKESLPKKDKYDTYTVVDPMTNDIEHDESVKADGVLRLLKSAFDHSKYNRREKFDHKAKKAEFDKKDYAARRANYTKYRKTTPKTEYVATTTMATTSESEEPLPRVMLNKDTGYLDLINEITANDVSMDDLQELSQEIESEINDLEPKPDQERKRMPTVYDFLFHLFDYVDSSERVYE